MFSSAAAAFVAVALAVYWSEASSPENDALPLPLLEPKVFGRPLTPDAPVMILIAGWPDTHEVWEHQVRAFADDYHIVSLTTPDYDNERLRRRWGYNFTEVPEMMARSLDAHLGPARSIDVMITHDWGAVWGYYLLQGALAGRVGRLVAVEIGSASHDDPTQPADIPSVAHATLFSVPYQLVCASIFAVGTTVSPALAEILVSAAWPLVPHVGPMAAGFEWGVHAPRPQSQVKWWMGYPYYHLWRTHRKPSTLTPQPST
jgi:pimeloyl-ACP methyl ester carboxylesterase